MIERHGDGYLVTAEDMQTLLIAARLGYAWSREEQSRMEEHPNQRRNHCRDRSDRIRSLVASIEEAMELPNSKRMLQLASPQIHPTRKAHSGDKYCAPKNRSSRYSAA